MKNKNRIQTIWNGVCAPFVVMGMALSVFKSMFSEGGSVTEKGQAETSSFNAVLAQAFLRLMPYILLGLSLTYLTALAVMEIWKRSELASVTFIVIIFVLSLFVYRRHKDENSNPVSHVISDDLIQLMAWSAFGVFLSFGIGYLIIEALEGGMGLEPERTFGVFFFIAFSATLVIMVIPETVRLLRGLGYIISLSEIRRRFLKKYRLGF